MTKIQTVHLIYGPTGAGKSTYARSLAAELNAVRFALDDWMHGLFSADMPKQMEWAWLSARVQRCERQIWSTSIAILATGRDVVLELGSLRESDRSRIGEMAAIAGYHITYTFVDAEREVRRKRVMQRNIEKSASWSFDVTPAMFDAVEQIFEPPGKAELARSIHLFTGEKHASRVETR